jgi:hypothetical protein
MPAGDKITNEVTITTLTEGFGAASTEQDTARIGDPHRETPWACFALTVRVQPAP